MIKFWKLSLSGSALRFAAILLISASFYTPVSQAESRASAKISAETLFREGKLDQASRDLQAALETNPNDVHALTLLGTVRRKQGEYRQAESLWIKAAQADSTAVAPVENLAKLYAEEEHTDIAVQAYESLLNASPKNPRFSAALADLYQKQGQYQKSLDLIESIPSTSRSDHLLVVRVADYIGLKQSDDLQKAVDAVLHRAAGDPDLVPQLANVLMDHGMGPDAGELLRTAGQHQKITANYLAAAAKMQAMSGQRQAAGETLKKALQLDPKSRQALFVAGRLAATVGNWKLADSYLEQMRKTGPPTPEYLQLLVLVDMRINDLVAAHDAGLELMHIQPDSPDAALTMCAVLIRAAHWGEADPLLDKVLAIRPGDKRALVGKGVVDYNMGRIDDAQKHLTASLGEGNGDPEADYYLGLIAKQKGDFPASASYLESALKGGPDNVDAMTALGQIYLAMGEAEKAKPLLEQAAARVPKDSQTHYQLAIAYKKLGLTDKAREQMALFQQLSIREGAKQPVGQTMKEPN